MTPLECLENDFFYNSSIIDSNGIKMHIEKIFEKYQTLIKQITEPNLARELKKQEQNISIFCEKIIASLTQYEKGYVQASYQDFQSAMETIKPFLFPENAGNVCNIIGLHKPLYRGRVGTNKPYSKGQLFHLPFSKREFASTQRFSIPGLPCLYLSNSIYVCWEELNRPALDTLQISRFQQEKFDLNILDISRTPLQTKLMKKSREERDFKSSYDYDISTLYFLMRWPLSFICSLEVTNENAPFKHEYIFPQFLLQWVTHEKEVDGIKYFSVKANPFNKEDFAQYTNYVFPPKKINLGNYCDDLKNTFKLTEPLSFELLKISDPNSIFLSNDWFDNIKYKVQIEIDRLELVKGFKMPYVHTLFGKMELFMHNLEVDFISENEMFNSIN